MLVVRVACSWIVRIRVSGGGGVEGGREEEEERRGGGGRKKEGRREGVEGREVYQGLKA